MERLHKKTIDHNDRMTPKICPSFLTKAYNIGRRNVVDEIGTGLALSNEGQKMKKIFTLRPGNIRRAIIGLREVGFYEDAH
jgi:hypothetical protein